MSRLTFGQNCSCPVDQWKLDSLITWYLKWCGSWFEIFDVQYLILVNFRIIEICVIFLVFLAALLYFFFSDLDRADMV